MLTLYIGNKNYSSWSMPPWIVMRQAGISFEEVKLRFDRLTVDSTFKHDALVLSPAGRVPVLADDDVVVWDPLAICEYLAEIFPEKRLWPVSIGQRARARSLCMEIHSGFKTMRSLCPMNIDAQLTEVGHQLMEQNHELREDLATLESMWEPSLTEQGPMLFQQFGIVDAFLAPICMRLMTYGLPVSPGLDVYVRRIRTLPSVQEWMQGAFAEQDFHLPSEPYRKPAAELLPD